MYLAQLFQITFDFHRVKIILHVGASNIRDSQELVSGGPFFLSINRVFITIILTSNQANFISLPVIISKIFPYFPMNCSKNQLISSINIRCDFFFSMVILKSCFELDNQARHGSSIGVDAIASLCPSFFKPANEGL